MWGGRSSGDRSPLLRHPRLEAWQQQAGFERRPAQSRRALRTLPPSPEPLFGGIRRQGVHRMWFPICPPPISAAYASARSQTSKNVKHVAPRRGRG